MVQQTNRQGSTQLQGLSAFQNTACELIFFRGALNCSWISWVSLSGKLNCLQKPTTQVLNTLERKPSYGFCLSVY